MKKKSLNKIQTTTRRSFLVNLPIVFSSCYIIFSEVACLKKPINNFWNAKDKPSLKTFTEKEYNLITSIQDRLLPSDKDFSGAKDVNATYFLDLILNRSDADKEDINIIKQGAIEIDLLSLKVEQIYFNDLSDDKKDKILKSFFEIGKKERYFLRVMMIYTLEALLGDPIYGGNVSESGWKSLNHQAGFPRPSNIEQVLPTY